MHNVLFLRVESKDRGFFRCGDSEPLLSVRRSLAFFSKRVTCIPQNMLLIFNLIYLRTCTYNGYT